MKRRVFLVIAAAALAAAGAANAHHSFAATYREDESVTIEGELVAFDHDRTADEGYRSASG